MEAVTADDGKRLTPTIRNGDATLATEREALSRHPYEGTAGDGPNPTTTIEHDENQDHHSTATLVPSAGISVDVAIGAGNGVASTDLGSQEKTSTSSNVDISSSGVSKASCGANEVYQGPSTEGTAENGTDTAISCTTVGNGTTSGLEDNLKTRTQGQDDIAAKSREALRNRTTVSTSEEDGAGTPIIRKGQWPSKYKMKCRFCGGSLCMRCSEHCARRCKGAAIRGLHSHWITESILAMQRPSSLLIKHYDILGQFKRAGVTAVFNLTEAGEHPCCGHGLEQSSGFPYLPETFMEEGIFFFHFAWEDMTAPPLSLLTDIVRVAVSCFRNEGKIAVHCHAGYGRTGLVIASILVFIKNLTAEQAIALVRDKRPGSLQTRSQVATVREFADFVRGVRVVYHFTDHARVTLGQHLTQQAFLLHGHESVSLRWLPKPVALATKMLVSLARDRPQEVVQALVGVTVHFAEVNKGTEEKGKGALPLPSWGMLQERRVKALQYASNGNDWSCWENMLTDCCGRAEDAVDPRIPAQLLYAWLAQLSVPALTITQVKSALPQLSLDQPHNKGTEGSSKPGAASGERANSSEDGASGPFFLLNLLPVGQIRLLQCLTACLKDVRNSLISRGFSAEGEDLLKASLRVAVSLFQLDKTHQGVIVGRDLAPDTLKFATQHITAKTLHVPSSSEAVGTSSARPRDLSEAMRIGVGPELPDMGPVATDLRLCLEAMGLLLKSWQPPFRCRPYTRLEGIDNRPKVHVGDEDYWKNKRRSVVPPKDLIQSRAVTGKEVTMSQSPTLGYTLSCASGGSAYMDDRSWDDSSVIRPSTATNERKADMRRRSLSSGNVKDLVHLPLEAIGPLSTDFVGTHT